MITITQNALQKTKQLMQLEDLLLSDNYMRINIIGGGCAGFSYDLFFDSKTINLDIEDVYEYDELRIVVNHLCLQYVEGTELDYIERMYGGGYKFNNPNTSTTCGCGSSFDVK